jgi:hypothetical protein
MQEARRRRAIAAVAFSVVIHLAILAAVVLQAPSLLALRSAEEPQVETVIPVVILPRRPRVTPPPTQVAPPSPVRPRAARLPAQDAPVEPLVLPQAPEPEPPAPPAIRDIRPAPMGPQEAEAVRQALMRRKVGCDAEPDRDAREACWGRIGRGVKAMGEGAGGCGLQG